MSSSGVFELAGAVEGGEGRAVLDGELVEREMIGGERQRLAELRRPGLRRLAGAGIDQVEGEAREGRARHLDRRARGGDVMKAAEEAEVVVVERLDAERDAVDAGGAVAAETLGLDAGGIGLERDLGVRRDASSARRSRRGWRRPSPGSISDGVPPPRKMLDTVRPGARSAVVAISRAKAAA